MPSDQPPQGPLVGLRVIDASNVLAGPLACQILGDFGADVVKVEHPVRGDAFRTHGYARDGHGLWWKMLSRNKRCIGLDLSQPDGAEILRDLVATADVLVENFRPGTMERWGLGWDVLREDNPRLVMARVTAFGQDGPYAHRPGFGTLVESMSGFAAMTGEPDGPPTLPPFGLADTIAAMAAVNAIMMALWYRDTVTGTGQQVDVSLLEPIATAMGPYLLAFDQLGIVPPRMGNRSPANAPRNTYLTRDGHWVAISTSTDSIAERVMALVDRPELVDEPWFATSRGRAEHGELLDEAVGNWIGERTRADVIAAFEAADAAVAPIYDAEDYLEDPQVQALEMVTTVNDDDLGPLRMQNVLFRMADTPGAIRWAGRALGADTNEILGGELGITAERRTELREREIIA